MPLKHQLYIFYTEYANESEVLKIFLYVFVVFTIIGFIGNNTIINIILKEFCDYSSTRTEKNFRHLSICKNLFIISQLLLLACCVQSY